MENGAKGGKVCRIRESLNLTLSEYISKYFFSLEIPLTLMWWIGNSCCFIRFCERFCVDHCGVLAHRVASIFRVRGLTRPRDSACRRSAQCAKALKRKKFKFVSAAHNGSYTHSHVFTFSQAVGSLCAWLCTSPSVYSCLSWWKMSPGRRVLSSEFKFKFHFDDAWICLVKPLGGGGTEEELQCKNQRILVQDG